MKKLAELAKNFGLSLLTGVVMILTMLGFPVVCELMCRVFETICNEDGSPYQQFRDQRISKKEMIQQYIVIVFWILLNIAIFAAVLWFVLKMFKD